MYINVLKYVCIYISHNFFQVKLGRRKEHKGLSLVQSTLVPKSEFTHMKTFSLTFFTKTKASGQDGDIGRYTLLPHTTKRRTTTNLKTKTNQNCQKIELYRNLTTKELKKKHSSRLVGGAERGSWG